MTSRTNHHAARHHHPGHWTWDDVAAALGEANATARPRGPYGPTPQTLWDTRTAITPDERRVFGAAVDARLTEMLTSQGQANINGSELRTTQRRAIRPVLVEQGFLSVSRKRIPLPIPSPKTAIIP